jgi:DNA-binding NtrC family response regulator
MKGNLRKGKDIKQIAVLSVGLGPEDNSGLAAIFARSEWPSCPNSEWKIEAAPSLRSAVPALGKGGLQIVVCEKNLGNDSWRDMLDYVRRQPDPPSLIVTSRVADDYLWAEALNLGAYDVLAAPFEPAEVVRVLSSAWLHRVHSKELTASKSMRTAMSNRAAFFAAS